MPRTEYLDRGQHNMGYHHWVNQELRWSAFIFDKKRGPGLPQPKLLAHGGRNAQNHIRRQQLILSNNKGHNNLLIFLNFISQNFLKAILFTSN